MNLYIKQTQVSAVQCTEEWFAPGADLAALSEVKGTKLHQPSGKLSPIVLIPDGNGFALSPGLGEWLVRDERGDLSVVNDAEFRANYQPKGTQEHTDLNDLNEGDIVRESSAGCDRTVGLNMIDWKRFEDEVPTEPRDVLCGTWRDGMTELEPYAYVDDGWVTSDDVYGHGHDPAAWLRVNTDRGFTHWAYVDPPGDIQPGQGPEAENQ